MADRMIRIQCGVVAAIAVTAFLSCADARRGVSRSESSGIPVLCLEYLGETDRPVLPVLIAGSEASANEYIRYRDGDRSLAHAPFAITEPEGLSCIRDVLPALGQLQEPSSMVKVRLWTRGQGERRVYLETLDAAAFLRAARRCLNQSSEGSGDVLNTLLSFVERSGSG